MISESTPTIGLKVNVLSSVSCELGKDSLGGLEVFPRSLGSDIDSTVGVARPAVLSSVPEVIWVGIGCLLKAIIALAVEPVLGLQS